MKDKFGREIDYLRISVTDNCNLRCVYCIDENSVFQENKNILSDDEIYRITKECAALGIRKIRITGGEPLVRKNIENLISRLNSIDGIEEIYITTNGVLLEEKLEDLKNSGLTGVNISLDSLKEERFKLVTKYNKLDKVILAIDKSLELGIRVKINTVIINDTNKDEIIDFIELTKDKKVDIRFIELMPIGAARKHKGMKNTDILDLIKVEYKDVIEYKRRKSGGPANYIRVNNYKGRIGFISAMSNCFCEECNRIRLTSEGFLKKCLHFNYGVNLKEYINDNISDEQLRNIIYENIYDKPEKHLFGDVCENKENRNMNQIGG
ncbi:MAG: GTP 3',8-cyclase MoaA [Peptostreptococcaceae bacterium]